VKRDMSRDVPHRFAQYLNWHNGVALRLCNVYLYFVKMSAVYQCAKALSVDKAVELLQNCRDQAVERLNKPKSGGAFIVKTNDGTNSKCYTSCFISML